MRKHLLLTIFLGFILSGCTNTSIEYKEQQNPNKVSSQITTPKKQQNKPLKINTSEETEELNTTIPPIKESLFEQRIGLLIQDYIHHTNHPLISSDRYAKTYIFDREETSGDTTFLFYKIGQTVTDENNTNPRYATDSWVKIDVSRFNLYEYDVSVESFSIYTNGISSCLKYIPKNYHVHKSQTGNLNLDTIPDRILVLENNDSLKRPLLIFYGTRNHTYKMITQNNNIILDKTMGGSCCPEPFSEITIDQGTFALIHFGGMSTTWVSTKTFNLDTLNQKWFLRNEAIEYSNYRLNKIKTEINDSLNVAFETIDIYTK